MLPPTSGNEWLALAHETLPVGAVYDWVGRPDCGAVVLFSGTVRDHAEGRAGVERLEYEAYDDVVHSRLVEIAGEIRRQWPTTGRITLLHRVGVLEVGESAVIAAVSAPHRPEAFEAARFAIDTLKAAVPIWKHETWSDGAGWGTGAQPIDDVWRRADPDVTVPASSAAGQATRDRGRSEPSAPSAEAPSRISS